MTDSSWRGFGVTDAGLAQLSQLSSPRRRGDIGLALYPKMDGPRRDEGKARAHRVGFFAHAKVALDSERQGNYRGAEAGAVTRL